MCAKRARNERGETGRSLKVCDERLQQHFQLSWKLFTAHKLPERTANVSLFSHSLHPIIPRIALIPSDTGLFYFFWIKKEREMAFCFILVFYYFHFLVFPHFFFFLEENDSSRWRRATTKPQPKKVEDDLSLASAPLSFSLFSSSLALSVLALKKRRRPTEKGSKAEKGMRVKRTDWEQGYILFSLETEMSSVMKSKWSTFCKEMAASDTAVLVFDVKAIQSHKTLLAIKSSQYTKN